MYNSPKCKASYNILILPNYILIFYFSEVVHFIKNRYSTSSNISIFQKS